MNENITLCKHIFPNINQVPKTEKANSEVSSCLTSPRSSSSSSYIYSLQRTRSKFEQTGKKKASSRSCSTMLTRQLLSVLLGAFLYRTRINLARSFVNEEIYAWTRIKRSPRASSMKSVFRGRKKWSRSYKGLLLSLGFVWRFYEVLELVLILSRWCSEDIILLFYFDKRLILYLRIVFTFAYY